MYSARAFLTVLVSILHVLFVLRKAKAPDFPILISFLSHLVVGSRASWAVVTARVLVKDTVIELPELRAAQTTNNGTDVLVDQARDWVQSVQSLAGKVGNSLLEELECEASEVVALKQRRSVIDTSCEVGDVHTGESVDFSGLSGTVLAFGPTTKRYERAYVSAKLEGAWVGKIAKGNVANNVLSLVRSVRRATVPVLGHPFLSRQPAQRTRAVSLDTEKLFEL